MVFNSSSRAELTKRCLASRAFPSNWLLTEQKLQNLKYTKTCLTNHNFEFPSTAVGLVHDLHVLSSELLQELGLQVVLRVATHNLKSETEVNWQSPGCEVSDEVGQDFLLLLADSVEGNGAVAVGVLMVRAWRSLTGSASTTRAHM